MPHLEESATHFCIIILRMNVSGQEKSRTNIFQLIWKEKCFTAAP